MSWPILYHTNMVQNTIIIKRVFGRMVSKSQEILLLIKIFFGNTCNYISFQVLESEKPIFLCLSLLLQHKKFEKFIAPPIRHRTTYEIKVPLHRSFQNHHKNETQNFKLIL